MELWQAWRKMALDSQEAAVVLEREGFFRSSMSRYYYAAFQAATAALHYCRVTPPVEEGWSHVSTPDLLRRHLEPALRSRDLRNRLAGNLGELYKFRIMADYMGEDLIDEARVKQAGSNARFLVKVIEDILPSEEDN